MPSKYIWIKRQLAAVSLETPMKTVSLLESFSQRDTARETARNGRPRSDPRARVYDVRAAVHTSLALGRFLLLLGQHEEPLGT